MSAESRHVSATGIPFADIDEQSYREAVFGIALRRFLSDESIADRTKRIFERTSLNGESPESIAATSLPVTHSPRSKCQNCYFAAFIAHFVNFEKHPIDFSRQKCYTFIAHNRGTMP